MSISGKFRVVTVIAAVTTSSATLIALEPGAGAAAPRTAMAGAAHHHHAKGDLDGDGKPDLVVGAPGGNRVRVAYTKAKPAGSSVQWLTPPETAHPSTPPYYGGVIAVGDFNNDGFSDLAVGAPSWTNPTTIGSNRETQGALYIYRGSATGLHYTGNFLHGPYNGEDPYDLATMAAAGDIDHDGYSDLAFKVDGGDTNQIEVVYGSHSGLDLAHPQFFDDFGAASMAIGNINKGHFPDLVLGDDVDLTNSSSVFEGAVQVIFGSAAGLTNHHREKIPARKFGVRNGLGSDTAVGDINHDGYDDVVVGDAAASHFPNHLSPGKIVVLLGGKHGITAKRHRTIDEKTAKLAKKTHIHDLFGASVAIAAINGDKYPDVLVGAPGTHVNGKHDAGAIYVLRGTKSGVSTKHPQRFTQASKGMPGNPQQGAQFGATVDLSQIRGHATFAFIGAPHGSYGATEGGFVAVLRTGAGGLRTKHARRITDATANDTLGVAIASR